jgi:uncharacterized protein YecE (DUF72 family)
VVRPTPRATCATKPTTQCDSLDSRGGTGGEDFLLETRPTSPQRCQARIGCAGWSIPRELTCYFSGGSSHLARYAQVFNACEINSSFYGPHRVQTWERWGESVPAGFQFSIKAPRTITHESALKCGLELLSPFLHQISFLQDKLGPILFQLPPSLHFESARARQFLTLLRESYSGDVVWEPRHGSWFADDANDLLKDFSIARVAADPACVPLAALPGGRLSLVYFRLHGSPRRYYSAYEDDFLDMLAEQMSELAASAQVWCVFDNTAAGSAIPNAMALRGKSRAES